MIDTTATEAYPNARDCEHGQLRRSCNICELESEIKELRAALSWAKNNWTGNEPSESVMNRYFDELDIT